METNVQNFKELQPGTALNGGKYVIERKLGEGGFGITYTAVQRGLNRAVCIKEYFLAGRCVRNTQAKTVHLQGGGEDIFEKYRKAFVKEAQTLASLHHPNIVEVIDIFDENNTSYMVMPFIEGRSLQSIVDKNGPLPYPEAVNYMAQITSAVDYIHKRNILHRDIKPDNIMITADYKAILIDFGSAREFQQDKTQAHTSMLTHGYAPPEQYTANSRKGSYTDIYAIGATLYFILTGQVPLEAAARLTEELVEPIKLNSSIPPEGNYTIMKAMRLKKEERYQTVQEFMDDLKNVNPQKVMKNVDRKDAKVKTEPLKEKKKSSKWLMAVLAFVIVVLGVAISMIVIQPRNSGNVDRHGMEIHRLDSLYQRALEKFDFHVSHIGEEKGLTNPTHVIESLEALKSVENTEKDPLFQETGHNACLLEKIGLYELKLKVEREMISRELEELEKDGLTQGDYPDGLRKKLSLIDRILDGIAAGSAVNVTLGI